MIMHWLDNDFFEAYKRLDKLCSDLCSAENGVSAYIAHMESKASHGRLLVPSWAADYKNLKHVRWVRNQIAHEADTLQISKPTDLSFVQDFHDRILSEEDPLTLFRKATAQQERKQGNRKPQNAPSHTPQTTQAPVQPPRRADRLSLLLALLCMVLLVLVFFAICLMFSR